ncbi:MAG: transketolase-like TK C-terminal-containing protein, partial [Chloroflexota bacterium]
ERVRGTHIDNVLWIVDLNRQILDRVIPGIKVREMEAMFRGIGWQVIEAKYGRRLQSAFGRPGGRVLRQIIDEMPNEEYQDLVRLPGAEARRRLLSAAPGRLRDGLARCLAPVPDDDLPALLGDLGGHDLAELLRCFHAADAAVGRPSVLFAYALKGWGLPIAGDPLNHSAMLTQRQIDELRAKLGLAQEDEWAAFPDGSAEGRLCSAAAASLYPNPRSAALPPASLTPADVPESVTSRMAAEISTQEAFGNTLVELARAGGPLSERIVTTSPDVTISTNLGGWVNRTGVWTENPSQVPATAVPRLLRWEPGPGGRHIELGISEMNLFMLLGQLGLSHELNGELLLPVGTVYDPFVCRGLDALIYGLYSGSKFVFAGTPAGISLSPEGGAHQSTVTPSLGIELPNLRCYEPCFAREAEWCLLEGLRQCLDREHGLSTYLRLSTRVVSQAPWENARDRLGEGALRRQVLSGGYRLAEADAPADPAARVVIAAAGAIIPEALQAVGELRDEGIAASLVNVTSAERLYAEWSAHDLAGVRSARTSASRGHVENLIPANERSAPIVTVLDGASHALAWLGAVFGQRVIPLGVDVFGQSGERSDVYGYAGIDSAHITNAAIMAVQEA